MRTVFIYFSGLLFLCLAACSEPSVNTSSPELTPTSNQQAELILTIDTNGGCMMMGPNCPRYELMSDGSFKVLRQAAGEIANSGQVDMQLVEQWLNVANKTDFKALLASLGEGECRACYDGVDVNYTILPQSKNINITSTEYEFSPTQDFFRVSNAVHVAMREAAPLSIKSR